MEFARVVRKRRMIRAFRPVPVPEAKIRRILELVQHYPSAGFSQGVAFILVTDPERIRRLQEQNRLRGDAPVLVVPCVSEKDRKSTRLNSSHGYISYAVFCL